MSETYLDLQRFTQQLNLCSVDFTRLCEIALCLAIDFNCVRTHLETIALVVNIVFLIQISVVKIFVGKRVQLLSRFQTV